MCVHVCTHACLSACACTTSWYVLLLIKCLPDRNVVLHCVRLEHSTTQKLFSTCTLSSIWSNSGGERRGSEEKACAPCHKPYPCLFLFYKTKSYNAFVFCGIQALVWSHSDSDFNKKGKACLEKSLNLLRYFYNTLCVCDSRLCQKGKIIKTE